MARPADRTARWGPALIAAAGIAAYANSLTGPFIFDDMPAIVQNPFIRHLWPIRFALSAPPTAQPVVQRPVIALSLALNYAAGGLHVWGYHAVNLIMHLLTACVFFGVLRRTLRSPALQVRYGRQADGLALAASLIWTVHPLLTESVTYVTQRTESLMGLWYLLTLYAVIRSAEPPNLRRWHAAAVGACLLGMGTKQTMLTAPLAVWCYDRTFLAGSFRDALRRRRGLYAGLAATWGVLAALIALGPQVTTAGMFLERLRLWDYLATQPGVILHYLRLAVWPHPLVIAYDWPTARAAGEIVLPTLIVLGWLVATAVALVRRRPAGFLGAWAFLTLGPTSLWPMATEPVAERRMYLPLAAVVALAVFTVHRILQLVLHGDVRNRLRRAISIGLVAAVTAAGVAATRRRNEDYRSRISIWSDTVAKWPRNPRAHANLGNALLEEGRIDEAIAHFQEALGGTKQGWVATGPGTPLLYHNLGVALARTQRLDEAIAAYRRALQLDPRAADTLYNLGLALTDQGRTQEAIDAYRKVVELDPASVAAHNNLGVALAKQGNLRDALEEFSQALRLDPADADAQANLKEARERLGRSDAR